MNIYIKMTTHYKLRIDILNHDDTITSGMKKFSYVKEQSDTNPHLHYHLCTMQKRDTIIKRIQKLPQYTKGNGFYSLKELKPEDDGYLKYDSYMTKEGTVQYTGFTSEEIDEINKYQEQVVAEMKLKKMKKRTQRELIEDKYFNDQILNCSEWSPDSKTVVQLYTFRDTEEVVTKEYVVKSVYGYYRENEILIREFMLVSLCQTLCSKYIHSYVYEFENRLLDKL